MAINMTEEQLQRIIAMVNTERQGSFAKCSINYNGDKNGEALEAFLSATSIYKGLEKINDENTIAGVPLLLTGEASIWWQGVKTEVGTWNDFQTRLRQAFAPKTMGYILYQDIVGTKQDVPTATESFVARKGALIAQLPKPLPNETHQLDMVFGQLHINIRKKVSRNAVKTFDELLEAARSAEEILQDQKPQSRRPQTTDHETPSKPAPRCRRLGHQIEECRGLKRKEMHERRQADSGPGLNTGAMTAPTPRFACYGCGKPGVVRSKCPVCSTKPTSNHLGPDFSFCTTTITKDSRARPTIKFATGRKSWIGYIDTGAKTSIASYDLYKNLQQQGHMIKEIRGNVTLADGSRRYQRMLTLRAPVTLQARVIPTTFIIFPEARETKTLLGMGFLEDAGLLLDIP